VTRGRKLDEDYGKQTGRFVTYCATLKTGCRQTKILGDRLRLEAVHVKSKGWLGDGARQEAGCPHISARVRGYLHW
jgi:hypothetical protein